MSKIIFWLVVVFVVLFVLRLVNIAKARSAGHAQQSKADPKAADAMVRCSECGIFLPRAEAVASAQGFRCGEPGCVQKHGNAR